MTCTSTGDRRRALSTGFNTIQDAFNSGDRETLLYVPAIVPDQSRPDYLAVVDVDPQSETYQQACCCHQCRDFAVDTDGPR
jgi:56kDa selenium binding protein (SBP56)